MSNELDMSRVINNLTAQIAQQATQIAILQAVIEQMTGTAEEAVEPTESEDVGTTD
jgi:hypothetical protein